MWQIKIMSAKKVRAKKVMRQKRIKIAFENEEEALKQLAEFGAAREAVDWTISFVRMAKGIKFKKEWLDLWKEQLGEEDAKAVLGFLSDLFRMGRKELVSDIARSLSDACLLNKQKKTNITSIGLVLSTLSFIFKHRSELFMPKEKSQAINYIS